MLGFDADGNANTDVGAACETDLYCGLRSYMTSLKDDLKEFKSCQFMAALFKIQDNLLRYN